MELSGIGIMELTPCLILVAGLSVVTSTYLIWNGVTGTLKLNTVCETNEDVHLLLVMFENQNRCPVKIPR